MRLQRVLLADDHRLLVEAFRVLLEPHYEVVGAVFDGHALLEAVLRLHPDVVVLDIAMPLLNGLDAGRQLKQKMPEVKLVILTMNQDPDLATKAMEAGASAYLLKSSAGSELFHAIAEALKGRSYVTKQIARGMQESFMACGDPRPGERAPRWFSPRPRQRGGDPNSLAEGKSMKEAGDVLGLKPRTVAFHKYRGYGRDGIQKHS